MIILIIFFSLTLKILPTIVEIISTFIPIIRRFNGYFISLRYGISNSRSLLGNIYSLGIMTLYLYSIFFSEAKKQKII